MGEVISSESANYRNRRREPILPDAVLGMTFFIIAECMLFAGFVSGHIILRANAMGGWPPPGQPRLPVEATAFNTVLLLASGALIFWAGRRFKQSTAKARMPFVAGVALGAMFVTLQGYEWFNLIAEGLTLTSSSFGSFFYIIVGTHALHAVSAIVYLGVLLYRLQRDALSRESLIAGQMFWFFVVGIWPLLYWQVYLR